ncbi:MAG: PqqD family protein [Longimicrobiales bacterium]
MLTIQEGMLTIHDVLEPAEPDVAAKVIDGEAIIMNLANGYYYSLEGVGAEAWEAIAAGMSLDRVIEHLVSRFDGATETVRVDVMRLAAELLAEGLVRRAVANNGNRAVANNGNRAVADNGNGAWQAAAICADAPTRFVDAYEPPCLFKYTDMAELLALDPPLPGLGPKNMT